jgi:hypothetical protein
MREVVVAIFGLIIVFSSMFSLAEWLEGQTLRREKEIRDEEEAFNIWITANDPDLSSARWLSYRQLQR